MKKKFYFTSMIIKSYKIKHDNHKIREQINGMIRYFMKEIPFDISINDFIGDEVAHNILKEK